jgi:acyl-CoA thioester hydrolase
MRQSSIDDLVEGPPPGARSSTARYRVPFYDTDAMRIVHHANYVRYLELARVRLLEEHDQPYTRYLELDLHFAVTRCEVRYWRPARFDDELAITCWIARAGGASVEIHYCIARGDELLVSARTEHATVDGEGRLRRLPPERRAVFRNLATKGATPG